VVEIEKQQRGKERAVAKGEERGPKEAAAEGEIEKREISNMKREKEIFCRQVPKGLKL